MGEIIFWITDDDDDDDDVVDNDDRLDDVTAVVKLWTVRIEGELKLEPAAGPEPGPEPGPGPDDDE